MRINVYHEELTDEVVIMTVAPRPEKKYIGVRLMLQSSPLLHHSVIDDDRSGITFWLGTKEEAIAYFERVLVQVKAH